MTAHRFVAAGLVIATMVSPVATRAAPESSARSGDDTRAAQRHFRRGIDLYNEGDTTEALAEFTRAYDLAPAFKILYNLAQVSCDRGDDVKGLRYFRRYLAEGGAEVPEERRQEVEREIDRLTRRKAPPAADVLDEDSILPLKMPRPKVSAPDIDLTPPIPAIDQPSRARPRRETPWITWTTAGVLAVGAAITGVMALSASNDLKERLNSFPTPPGQVEDLRVKERRLGLAADALTVSAAVAVAVALYRTFSDPPTDEQSLPPRIALLRWP